MNSIAKHICAVALVAFAANASGQDVMTLNEAIRIGLENNYSIRVAKNEQQIAANNNTYGNAGFLPKIDATVGTNLRASDDETTALDGTKTSKSPSTSNLNAGISLSWTLFDGMSMFVQKDKLKLLQEVGDVNFRASAEQVAANIISLYYTIAQQKHLIEVYDEAMAISKTRAEVAQKAKMIGSGSDVAYIKAEVDYKTDSSNKVQQTLYLQNYKADLNVLLGREPSTEFDVEDANPSTQIYNYNDLLEKGLSQSTSIIAARQQQSISELDVKNARASKLPRIDLSSNYTFNNYNYKQGVYDKNTSYGPYIGITAGITLFNGFNANRNLKNAKIKNDNAMLGTQQTEELLKSSILKAYNAYQTNMSIVDIEENSLVLAQRNLDIAIKAYQIGAISDLEMRDTQKNFIDVSYRLLNAKINLKDAEVELKRISGTLIMQK